MAVVNFNDERYLEPWRWIETLVKSWRDACISSWKVSASRSSRRLVTNGGYLVLFSFTWSSEKTHLTLIQRCALTVQLQPSIAHIPGGALSTLPGRNTRHHKNTDHTIARSHFSPFRALNTLLLPLIFLDPTRRSSEETKGRVVRRPRSIVFDFLAQWSSSHRSPHTVILERRSHFHRSRSSLLLLEIGHICVFTAGKLVSPEKLLLNTLVLDALMRTKIKIGTRRVVGFSGLYRDIDPCKTGFLWIDRRGAGTYSGTERSEVDGKLLERIPAAS